MIISVIWISLPTPTQFFSAKKFQSYRTHLFSQKNLTSTWILEWELLPIKIMYKKLEIWLVWHSVFSFVPASTERWMPKILSDTMEHNCTLDFSQLLINLVTWNLLNAICTSLDYLRVLTLHRTWWKYASPKSSQRSESLIWRSSLSLYIKEVSVSRLLSSLFLQIRNAINVYIYFSCTVSECFTHSKNSENINPPGEASVLCLMIRYHWKIGVYLYPLEDMYKPEFVIYTLSHPLRRFVKKFLILKMEIKPVSYQLKGTCPHIPWFSFIYFEPCIHIEPCAELMDP